MLDSRAFSCTKPWHRGGFVADSRAVDVVLRSMRWSAARPQTIGAITDTTTDDFATTIIATKLTLVAVHLRPGAAVRHVLVRSDCTAAVKTVRRHHSSLARSERDAVAVHRHRGAINSHSFCEHSFVNQPMTVLSSATSAARCDTPSLLSRAEVGRDHRPL
jgi:hypothetical protein